MSQSIASPSTPYPNVRYKSRDARRAKDRLFVGVCLFAASISVVALVTLITSIVAQAFGFVFESRVANVLLGVAVLGIGAGGIATGVLLPAVLRGRGQAGGNPRYLAIGAASLILSLALLAYLWTLREGQVWLTWSFLRGVPSRFAEEAGIWPATVGTIMICLVCALTAIPIGIATAILLEEYRPQHPWLRKPHAFVQLNITNLAGVPSIVYGILGLTVFVQMFNIAGTTLAPVFEFGVTRYDRFLTEGGEAVRVKIHDAAAPETDPATVTQWHNEKGEPVSVTLMDRAEFLPQSRVVEDRIEAFQEGVADAIEEGAADAAAIGAIVAQQWQAAGMKADLSPMKDEIVQGLLAAQTLEGRDARRARRQAMNLAEFAEKRVEFPGVLLTDAVPSRISDTAPWYVRFPFGRGVLAGGLTLMLVVLPIVIISSQEALRSVPRSMRYASLALGATPWQTVWQITLPTAIPGIMTGTILAMSRAIGEAAPILIIAGIVFITYTPGHLMDDFTALPLQIFNWASRPQQEFHDIAAAGIIILMAILLSFNALAVFIRQRTQKQY